MENLYNLRTLAIVSYKDKDLVHGVSSNHQLGMPNQVVQKEIKLINHKEEMYSAVKSLACSVYD